MLSYTLNNLLFSFNSNKEYKSSYIKLGKSSIIDIVNIKLSSFILIAKSHAALLTYELKIVELHNFISLILFIEMGGASSIYFKLLQNLLNKKLKKSIFQFEKNEKYKKEIEGNYFKLTFKSPMIKIKDIIIKLKPKEIDRREILLMMTKEIHTIKKSYSQIEQKISNLSTSISNLTTSISNLTTSISEHRNISEGRKKKKKKKN